MKLQFSIAGVMGLTLIISLGLWSLMYANFLFAHVATTSLLAGGVVGCLVGLSYGQGERGCIAGVFGALLWTCVAALADLQGWSPANRLETWGLLAVIAAFGAVPMSSTVAVYDRSSSELVVRPMISCVVAVAIAGLAATIGLVIMFVLYPPGIRLGSLLPRLVARILLLVFIFWGVALCVGSTYGGLAIALRALEAEGRKYRQARIAKSNDPGATTAEHKDPATADHR